MEALEGEVQVVEGLVEVGKHRAQVFEISSIKSKPPRTKSCVVVFTLLRERVQPDLFLQIRFTRYPAP